MKKLWIASSVLFAMVWCIFLPIMAANPHLELTSIALTKGGGDRNNFTDSRGLTLTVARANEECLIAVYIAASKVAAKHASAPLDTPDRIYMQCMFDHGVMI